MYPGIVYVWSSGLEQWEETSFNPPTDVTFCYPKRFVTVGTGKYVVTYCHSKTMAAGRLDIFTDPLNRFVGVYVSNEGSNRACQAGS